MANARINYFINITGRHVDYLVLATWQCVFSSSCPPPYLLLYEVYKMVVSSRLGYVETTGMFLLGTYQMFLLRVVIVARTYHC